MLESLLDNVAILHSYFSVDIAKFLNICEQLLLVKVPKIFKTCFPNKGF